MGNRIKNNLIGDRYNRLTVVSMSRHDKGRSPHWLCVCDCGNETIVRGDSLSGGHTKSCGCLSSEWAKTGDANRTHGKSNTKIFKVWQGIKSRCSNSKRVDFKHYGGRGISLCERWKNFEFFLEDMGYQPSGCTIERVNNDGDYEPKNCVWIDKSLQNKNKRSNILITFMGKTQCLKDWSTELNINYWTLHKRIRYQGKTVEEAFK